jgi:WD40 repeat protein
LNYEKTFPDSAVRFLGFADRNTALLVAEKRNKHGQGEIVRWDVRKSQKAGALKLSPWISAYHLRLSPDGKYLATTSDPSSMKFKHAKVYRVTVLNASNFKVVATRDISEREYCVGVLFSPSEAGKVLLKMRSLIPYKSSYVGGKGYLEVFDIRRHKIVRSIPYSPSYEADRIVPSIDGKTWMVIYYSFFFDNDGEAAGALDKDAVLDVIDPKTGKILWHIPATKKITMGDPVISLSPHEFVSSASIFNRVTRTSRPWPAARLRPTPDSLISEVPGKPQFVVLETKTGLKIRNWGKGKDIKSWPVKGEIERAFFSPDLKTMGYIQDQKITFLNFNPALLKQ